MTPLTIEPVATRSDEFAERRAQYQRQMANAYNRWQTLLESPFSAQWQYISAVNGLVVSCWDDDTMRIRISGVVRGRNSRWRRVISDGNPETRAQWDQLLGASVRQSETMGAQGIAVVDAQTRETWMMPPLFLRMLVDVDRSGNQVCFCTLDGVHPYLQPAPPHADAGIRVTLGVRLLPVGSDMSDLTLVFLCDTAQCWWRTRMFFSPATMIEQLVAYVDCIQDIVGSDDKWRSVYHRKK